MNGPGDAISTLLTSILFSPLPGELSGLLLGKMCGPLASKLISHSSVKLGLIILSPLTCCKLWATYLFCVLCPWEAQVCSSKLADLFLTRDLESKNLFFIFLTTCHNLTDDCLLTQNMFPIFPSVDFYFIFIIAITTKTINLIVCDILMNRYFWDVYPKYELGQKNAIQCYMQFQVCAS